VFITAPPVASCRLANPIPASILLRSMRRSRAPSTGRSGACGHRAPVCLRQVSTSTAPCSPGRSSVAIDRARCHISGANKGLFHLAQNRAAIGIFVQPDNGEKDKLFEGSQQLRHVYKVDKDCTAVKQFRSEVSLSAGKLGRMKKTWVSPMRVFVMALLLGAAAALAQSPAATPTAQTPAPAPAKMQFFMKLIPPRTTFPAE